MEAIEKQRPPHGSGRDVTDLAVGEAYIGEATLPANIEDVLQRVMGAVFLIKARRMGVNLRQATHAEVLSLEKAVKADLEARAEMGRKKYGERLRAFNGRDAELDLLQELYDAWVYSRQLKEERSFL